MASSSSSNCTSFAPRAGTWSFQLVYRDRGFEWADRAGGWLPADRWDIRLAFSSDPSTRDISIERIGAAPSPPEFPC